MKTQFVKVQIWRTGRTKPDGSQTTEDKLLLYEAVIQGKAELHTLVLGLSDGPGWARNFNAAYGSPITGNIDIQIRQVPTK